MKKMLLREMLPKIILKEILLLGTKAFQGNNTKCKKEVKNGF